MFSYTVCSHILYAALTGTTSATRNAHSQTQTYPHALTNSRTYTLILTPPLRYGYRGTAPPSCRRICRATSRCPSDTSRWDSFIRGGSGAGSDAAPGCWSKRSPVRVMCPRRERPCSGGGSVATPPPPPCAGACTAAALPHAMGERTPALPKRIAGQGPREPTDRMAGHSYR
jgi:hypothetical protein